MTSCLHFFFSLSLSKIIYFFNVVPPLAPWGEGGGGRWRSFLLLFHLGIVYLTEGNMIFFGARKKKPSNPNRFSTLSKIIFQLIERGHSPSTQRVHKGTP
jgi:hypothetical protein